jgi:hypothetical protein
LGITVSATKEKAQLIGERAVQEGEKAWENALDIKDRLEARANEARERLAARIDRIKGTTIGEKMANLVRSAKVWGLTNIVVPIEDRLRAIYEIPARIKDWRASREDTKAQKQQAKIERVQKKAAERVAPLQAKIDKINEAMQERVGVLSGPKEEAEERARKLKEGAEARRKQASRFSGARRALEGLQTQ